MDRLEGDVQLARDLRIGASATQVLEHLGLALG
jgi:hypothetical protein